jgi:hypothetical protein
MVTTALRRSFIAFHLTLGLTLLFLSLRTVLQTLGPEASGAGAHVAVLGTIETIGAALFLLPRTLRIGGALLLLTIGGVAVLHALAGQFRGDLLIYAVGTWFVMVHGPGAGAIGLRTEG